MPTIHIKKLDQTTFEVTVQDRMQTIHIVNVTPDYAAKLTAGSQASVEQLLTRSFEFLLQRESNSSILRKFDLPVIGNYFPEYEREIDRTLKHGDTNA
jgi:hypothetical protein